MRPQRRPHVVPVSALRARCPHCRTLTAVASTTGTSAMLWEGVPAGLVRVPRAWGVGGDRWRRRPDAAPLSRGARRRTGRARGAVRRHRARPAPAPARSRGLLLRAHRRDPWARGAARPSRRRLARRPRRPQHPRAPRRGTPGACRCGWRSTREASGRRTSRSSAPATSTRRSASTSQSRGSTTTSPARSAAPTPSTSRSTSTSSSRAAARVHAGAGRPRAGRRGAAAVRGGEQDPRRGSRADGSRAGRRSGDPGRSRRRGRALTERH